MDIAGKQLTYTNRIQKISILSLLLSPILTIYGWPSLSFALILSIVIIFLYIGKGYNILRPKNTPSILLIYFGFWLITNIIHAQSFREFLSLGVIITILSVITSFELFKFDYFLKYYRIIAYITIAYLLIQIVVLNTTGVLLRGVTDKLPISFLLDDISDWYESNEYGMRPSSFFSEPAHMAQFLLPLLCIELFSVYKNAKRAIFIVFVLLILQAGNGYVGLGIIGIIYAIKIINTKTLKDKLTSLFLILICSVGLVYFLGSDMGESVKKRTDSLFDYNNTIAIGADGTSSAFLRIYRGFYVFETFSTEQKLFGIGNNQTQLYEAQNRSSVSLLFGDKDNYMSGIQNILVKTGMIGLFLFLLLTIQLWKMSDVLGKSLLSLMVVIMFISSIFFKPLMLMCLIIPWHYKHGRINK